VRMEVSRAAQPAPSASHVQALQVRTRAEPTCSRCHTQGHTMSSKACPLRYAHLVPSSTSTAPPNTLPLSTTPTSVPLPLPDPTSSSVSPRQLVSPPEAISDEELQAFSPSAVLLLSSLADVPPSPDAPPSQEPEIRYDHPRAIYQRYVAAREAWYKKLPRGSLKTNQQYRKAMGLPQRYNKTSYDWCLDYKQMGKRYTATRPSRDWTKEEVMAYLDWTKAEDERAESRVAKEMGDNPLSNQRRGMADVWKSAEQDSRYRATNSQLCTRTATRLKTASWLLPSLLFNYVFFDHK
jgi:hypothetical protein